MTSPVENHYVIQVQAGQGRVYHCLTEHKDQVSNLNLLDWSLNNVFKDCGLVKTSVQVSEDCKEQLNRRQVWTTFKKIQTNNSCELCLSGDGGRGLQIRCESDQRLWPRACCAAVRQQGGEGGRSARCCPTLHCAALPGGRGEGGESQGDNLLLKMQPYKTCTNRSGAGASLRCRRSDAH